MAKLFEVADFDPDSVSSEKKSNLTSESRLARDSVLAFQH